MLIMYVLAHWSGGEKDTFRFPSWLTVALIAAFIWEFAKIRGTLFGGPYNKDLTV